uniref:Uncharacterized protein n=1 Tax=Nelumbo nucifera TaxID=4432 RepID=A0A822ZZU2_NELNU|nr:TPA_asm: hypothetical protein HUJ06_017395 [Nelumbo nucifera]
MRFLYSLVPFLFLLVILTFPQLSSSHYIHRATSKLEAGPRSRTEVSTQASWRFSAVPPSPNLSNSKADPFFGASDRVVPGGPNPLHN